VRRLVTLLLLAGACAPVAAAATIPGFRSPSGNIKCLFIPSASTGSGGRTPATILCTIAHADYGKNPPPAYPAIARRRAQQGTVTIRVLVDIDGVVQRAEIAESSGFDVLDDAAIETVRRRWRFVPARSAGNPIESWVLVPIRFALTEANQANAAR